MVHIVVAFHYILFSEILYSLYRSLILFEDNTMALSIFLLLASFYISAALGGTLQVIDYDGQCVIWSDDNNGCTGHSASFGLLDGNSCSGE